MTQNTDDPRIRLMRKLSTREGFIDEVYHRLPFHRSFIFCRIMSIVPTAITETSHHTFSPFTNRSYMYEATPYRFD